MSRQTATWKVILAVSIIVSLSLLSFIGVQRLRPSTPSNDEDNSLCPIEKDSALTFYFPDRYGVLVQSKLYLPDSDRPAPAVVFAPGWKADNSIYTWIYDNLTAAGFVVMAIDFVNNSNVWSETENGRISGMYCDTYNVNSTMPAQYSGDQTFWPDVWPWQHEILDAVRWLINASEKNEVVTDRNRTVYMGDRVDSDRIALIGHSTGAAMSIVSTMLDKRIKCCVALAPYDKTGNYWPPYPTDYTYLQGAAPIQIQVGSQDSVTPKNICAYPIYDSLSAPKQLITIKGGNHIFFMDTDAITKPGIVLPEGTPMEAAGISADEQKNISWQCTRTFLAYYLLGDKESPYELHTDLIERNGSDISIEQDHGDVIIDFNYSMADNLTYIFHAHIAPEGVGWGNSTVTLTFWYSSLMKEEVAQVEMKYKYGMYTEPYTGEFASQFRRAGTYYVKIEANSTVGQTYTASFTAIMI